MSSSLGNYSETQSQFLRKGRKKSTPSLTVHALLPLSRCFSYILLPLVSAISIAFPPLFWPVCVWRPQVSSRYLLNHSSPHFLRQSVTDSGTSWLARLAGRSHAPGILWLPSVEPTGLQLRWLFVRVLQSKTLVFTLMQSSTD